MTIPRAILSHRLDEAGVRVLRLACGHERHVPHRPPWSNFPWALDDTSCDAKLGQPIECMRCTQRELPEGVAAYKQTKTFDEQTVPAGLLRDHRTAAGVWGRLVVEAGLVRLHFAAPLGTVAEGSPDAPIVIPPELEHHAELEPGARFHVEFLR